MFRLLRGDPLTPHRYIEAPWTRGEHPARPVVQLAPWIHAREKGRNLGLQKHQSEADTDRAWQFRPPFCYTTGRGRSAFGVFFVSGLVEPLGALAGYLFFGWLNNDLLLGLVVARFVTTDLVGAVSVVIAGFDSVVGLVSLQLQTWACKSQPIQSLKRF